MSAKVQYKIGLIASSLLCLWFNTNALHALTGDKIPSIHWDLSDLYENRAAWDQARLTVLSDLQSVAALKDTFSENPQNLLVFLERASALNKSAARVFVYASLQGDEDLRNAAAQERLSLARSMFATLAQQTAFVASEIIKLGASTIDTFLVQEPKLEKYRFLLNDILRSAPHTLGAQAEEVIANASETVGGAQRIYSLLTTTAINWPKVTLSSGQVVTLDQANYAKYRLSLNRADRKAVFDSFWSAWQPYEAALGQTLDTLVRSHIFTAKSRHYPSALTQALADANIPEDVYRTLINAANNNLSSMYRYLKLRQRIMGLKDAQYYDIYPAVTYMDRQFTVEEAKKLTLNSLAPLGDEYLSLLQSGLNANWMHLSPQEGKRPGAYMQGAAYDVHPYILLNYNGNYDDVSTFSHEWGHAVHTLLARQNNPYETYNYKTFTAELASTTNEVLLQEHMLSQDLSDAERLYYIDRALEGIRGSFFRQSMFAEFELRIHEIAEAGDALSGKRMSAIYLDLLKKYHGNEHGVMTIDPAYAIEWAYIPHFYFNFYVYQYATSISGGTMFAENILSSDDGARTAYLGALKAGGSVHPYPLLKQAGVDLASPAPYNALIKRMNRLMDEAEQILARQGK